MENYPRRYEFKNSVRKLLEKNNRDSELICILDVCQKDIRTLVNIR